MRQILCFLVGLSFYYCPYANGQGLVRGYIVIEDTITKLKRDSLTIGTGSLAGNLSSDEVIEKYTFPEYRKFISLKTEKRGISVLLTNGKWYFISNMKLVASPSMFISEGINQKNNIFLILMFNNGSIVELNLTELNEIPVRRK
jgi:hypothetical protein